MKNTPIFGKDLAIYHPYTGSDGTTPYYTKIANALYDALLPLSNRLTPPRRKSAALILTAYFEDIIAETNLFGAFTTSYLKEHGKRLPFYDTTHYFAGEVNTADIAFLLWDFLQQLPENEGIISPLLDELLESAQNIERVLDEAFEEAPINESLRDFFSIDRAYSLYELQARFFWLGTESYLLYSNGRLLQEALEEGAEEVRKEGGEVELQHYVAILCGDFAYNAKTELLGKRPAQWLAEVLGFNHPLYADLSKLSEKVSSYFRTVVCDEQSITLQQIASGKEIRVAPDSMQGLPPSMFAPGTVLYGGFVEWQGSWWLVGPARGYKESEELLAQLKDSKEEQMAFEGDTENRFADLPTQETLFKKYKQEISAKSEHFIPERLIRTLIEDNTLDPNFIKTTMVASYPEGKSGSILPILWENWDFLIQFFRC